jgi:hypothetical protein
VPSNRNYWTPNIPLGTGVHATIGIALWLLSRLSSAVPAKGCWPLGGVEVELSINRRNREMGRFSPRRKANRRPGRWSFLISALTEVFLSRAVSNVSGCKSTNEELDEVVDNIRGLLTDGFAADEIVIAGRLNDAGMAAKFIE